MRFYLWCENKVGFHDGYEFKGLTTVEPIFWSWRKEKGNLILSDLICINDVCLCKSFGNHGNVQALSGFDEGKVFPQSESESELKQWCMLDLSTVATNSNCTS